jgi:hypothetical protein
MLTRGNNWKKEREKERKREREGERVVMDLLTDRLRE